MTLTSYSSSGSISATNTFTAGLTASVLLLRAVGDGTTGSAQLGAVNNHIFGVGVRIPRQKSNSEL